jgi:hypothetical protein
MFASVHCCTGDLALEVLIFTFFGDLPTASLYLGTRTMAVKETIRINQSGESAVSNRILAELDPLSNAFGFGVRRLAFTVHRFGGALRLFRKREQTETVRRPRLLRPAPPNGERRTPNAKVLPLIAKSIVPLFRCVSRIRSLQLLQIDSDLYLSP